MKAIPSGFLDTSVTDLQVCWRVIRRDSVEILGTEYDQDITLTTGDYAGIYLARAGITGSDIRTTSDLSVDNLEVTGALSDNTGGDSSSSSSALTLLDLNAADIEAGLIDNAEVVTFLVNATAPDLYQLVLRSGWIGNTQRTAEGQYKTELRGLTQALSQGIVRTYSIGCDAELGDERCKKDLTALLQDRHVIGPIIPRRSFDYNGSSLHVANQVVGGKVTWTSGLNTGYSMEIKEHDGPVRTITLYLPTPNDIGPGDDFTFSPGCDKTFNTCKFTYDNLVNRRAHAIFVPGQTEILKVGKRR